MAMLQSVCSQTLCAAAGTHIFVTIVGLIFPCTLTVCLAVFWECVQISHHVGYSNETVYFGKFSDDMRRMNACPSSVIVVIMVIAIWQMAQVLFARKFDPTNEDRYGGFLTEPHCGSP